MTLQERLDDAHRRSVSLYLKRQQVEEQRQQQASVARAIDMELVKLDGEIAVLTALLAEPARG